MKERDKALKDVITLLENKRQVFNQDKYSEGAEATLFSSFIRSFIALLKVEVKKLGSEGCRQPKLKDRSEVKK